MTGHLLLWWLHFLGQKKLRLHQWQFPLPSSSRQLVCDHQSTKYISHFYILTSLSTCLACVFARTEVLSGCRVTDCGPDPRSWVAFLEGTCWGRSRGKHRSVVAEVEIGFSPAAQKEKFYDLYPEQSNSSKLKMNIDASRDYSDRSDFGLWKTVTTFFILLSQDKWHNYCVSASIAEKLLFYLLSFF